MQNLKDYKSSGKTISLQSFLNSREDQIKDFVKLYVSADGINSTVGAPVVTEAEVDNYLGLLFTVDGKRIIGYVPIGEIRRLISSNVEDIQNIVYFLNFKKKLSKNAYESIENNEISILNRRITSTDTSAYEYFFDEQRYLTCSTFLPDQNILFITRIDTRVIYTKLISFRNRIFLANIGFAMILIFLAIVFSRHITTPIHKLIEASQNIGRGNLDDKIEVETNDEIQILIDEFELMRTRLKESYHDMEKKIQRRTRELQEAQAQISHQEKMASLGMMAAGIAHEIGNPLTSISSMAQVIKRKNENQNINEYLTNILKNIERISRIVKELVDFSRPSSYEAAPCDINDIIKSAVGIIKYDRRSKNIMYSLTLEPELPKTILVSDHLLQVFLNILINSVDACEGYGDKISVRSFTNNGKIHIEISDKGCGIPAPIQKKIFEPFFTTKEVGKGTGLGLTVSYGFIKKLEGEIKVKSEAGKGSTFVVIIPIRAHFED